MAINIQEILHPSDSDAIKFEKINYNFDQIVANGGGPTGQKGGQGMQGAKGNTGAKGQKGDVGPQGLTGATTSRWKVITVNDDPNSLGTYSILKPKLETDEIHPHIFLGDQLFNENTGSDGKLDLRATLTIGKNAQGIAGFNSDEYLRFWHGQNLNASDVSIDLQSNDISADNSVRYVFGKSFNVAAGQVVEFLVDFDRFTISGNSTFKVPVTNSGTAAEGLIRYNSSSNKFEGGIDDGGNIVWTEFCMAPCGGGSAPTYSIEISPTDDLALNDQGYPTGNSVSFTPDSDVEIDADGDPWSETTTSSTTTTTATPSYTFTVTFLESIDNAAWSSTGTSTRTRQVTLEPGEDTTITESIDVTSGYEFSSTSVSDNSSALTGTTISSGTTSRQVSVTVTMPIDATGNQTGTVTVTGYTQAITTTQPTYTVQYINGNTVNYDTCQLNSPVYNATYQGSSAGAFSIVSAAIANDNSYTGVSGQFCKIVSSDEPNFQWDSYIFNHSYTSGGTDCSTVTTTTTQAPYTVSYWEQSDHTTICDATTSNYTMDYPANLANSGAAFRSYFKNNYIPNTGTTRSVKIISSTESNFQSAGWTIRMDDDGNTDINWAECAGHIGSNHTVTNTTSQSRQFSYYPVTGGGTPVMTVDSPLGAGSSRTVCHWANSSSEIMWVTNGAGDPAIPPQTAYGTIVNNNSICS